MIKRGRSPKFDIFLAVDPPFLKYDGIHLQLNNVRMDPTKYILMSVITHVMDCWNRRRYISASQKCRWKEKNTIAIKSREVNTKMRGKTYV
jgi:hypothetical protein